MIKAYGLLYKNTCTETKTYPTQEEYIIEQCLTEIVV